MLRKSVAALLLLTITAWAEVVLAPMFTIHAGHRHAVHTPAQPHDGHQHAMPASHDCCPGLHKSASAGPKVELTAAVLPCEEQHRCCFRQGPQSPPSPAPDTRRPSPDISENSAQLDANLIARPLAWPATTPALRPPPGTFDMVLRI